jgi:hypothetical protein
MTKKIKQILTIATVALAIQSCSTIKVPCERVENGIKITETVIVQRHPEKQYQQAIKTTDFQLKATIDVLEKVKIADLDANTKTKVTELRDKLNQYSSMTQDIIKGSYGAYQTTPCDKDVRKRHFDLLDNIAKENSALEKLRAELTALSNKGNFGGVDENKVKSLLEQYNSNNGEKAFTK